MKAALPIVERPSWEEDKDSQDDGSEEELGEGLKKELGVHGLKCLFSREKDALQLFGRMDDG